MYVCVRMRVCVCVCVRARARVCYAPRVYVRACVCVYARARVFSREERNRLVPWVPGLLASRRIVLALPLSLKMSTVCPCGLQKANGGMRMVNTYRCVRSGTTQLRDSLLSLHTLNCQLISQVKANAAHMCVLLRDITSRG